MWARQPYRASTCMARAHLTAHTAGVVQEAGDGDASSSGAGGADYSLKPGQTLRIQLANVSGSIECFGCSVWGGGCPCASWGSRAACAAFQCAPNECCGGHAAARQQARSFLAVSQRDAAGRCAFYNWVCLLRCCMLKHEGMGCLLCCLHGMSVAWPVPCIHPRTSPALPHPNWHAHRASSAAAALWQLAAAAQAQLQPPHWAHHRSHSWRRQTAQGSSSCSRRHAVCQTQAWTLLHQLQTALPLHQLRAAAAQWRWVSKQPPQRREGMKTGAILWAELARRLPCPARKGLSILPSCFTVMLQAIHIRLGV